MQTVMVYSEAGGVSKTTTAVSVAMTAAEAGRRVILIDLDPRAASTKWLRVSPAGEGLDIGAILGAKGEDPVGWAEDMAVSSLPGWHPNLRVIPSARSVSNREADRDDYAELRLKASLEGVSADVVIIDCPNRQGGPLTLSALSASDTVLYAATASDSGIDGVEGAQRTIAAFKRSRERIGAPVQLIEAGVAVTRDGTGFLSIPEQEAIDTMREAAPLIEPIVPHLAIVPEVRMAGEWYGNYRKGATIRDAYASIMRKVIQ